MKSEAGVSVVEMLVASFILGLGVMGVASLLLVSARTSATADQQSDASTLASSELEIIRSLDFNLVGIDPSSDGYQPESNDRRTVTEKDGNLVDAVSKVEVGDIVYRVDRSVTWAAVRDDPEAYKIIEVTVFWESRTGTRSVTVQTGLHEGLFGG